MIAKVSRTNPNRRLKRTSRRALKNKQRETGRRESSESRYIGVGGTKVCIESRNANASNIDTASPFERSLNLSRHSSHPFFLRLVGAKPNTVVCAHIRLPALISPAFQNGKTHARAEDEWVEWKDPPINRMCGL